MINEKYWASKCGKLQRNCRDCVYYAESAKCCDYLAIVGHQRPCPPGDACTVKESGEKIRIGDFVGFK